MSWELGALVYNGVMYHSYGPYNRVLQNFQDAFIRSSTNFLNNVIVYKLDMYIVFVIKVL